MLFGFALHSLFNRNLKKLEKKLENKKKEIIQLKEVFLDHVSKSALSQDAEKLAQVLKKVCFYLTSISIDL